VPFERGKSDAALAWLVPVVEHVTEHAQSLLPRDRPHIRVTP